MSRLGAASLTPGRSGHETALRCWASNDVRTTTQRHRPRALRSRQTGARSTRTTVRCAPVGWCCLCCGPRHPSLLCCAVCPPRVAQGGLVGRRKRRTHSPNETKPRRGAQLAARAACELVRSPRNPQATTTRRGLTGSKGAEGRTPIAGGRLRYVRICSANLPGAGSKGWLVRHEQAKPRHSRARPGGRFWFVG